MVRLQRVTRRVGHRRRRIVCPALVVLALAGLAVWQGSFAWDIEPEQQVSSERPGDRLGDASGEEAVAEGSTEGPNEAATEASQGSATETVRSSPESLDEELARVGADGPAAIFGPRDLFDLQGIDQSHFDLLTDGMPWQEGEDETLLKIMYRLQRNFRLMDVERWSRGEPPPDLAETPDAYRGEIFRLAGRVRSLEVLRPVPEVAQRFELVEYYRCDLLLGGEQPAVLFAHTVPEAWKAEEPVDARAGAMAVFLKMAGEDPQRPLPVFVTARVAWYPPTRLGNLGFDCGLFDDLRPRPTAEDQEQGSGARPRRRPKDLQLTARNRECFYQMLAAAGRTRPGDLLAEAAKELKGAGRERFSVVPLFNQPLQQQGRLLVLSGTARQVILVRVSDEDVLARFGIDRYYQIFLFTEDSQQNPLVFCVREVPEGMPIGEGAQFGEHVTVAGFFFNTWAYRNRRAGDGATAREEWQLAPLLIGRDLQWHPRTKPASNPYLGAIAGGLFVLALLGIWLALWRYSRSDKQFHDRTIAPQFALDSGVSLDAIGLEADGAPDFSGLEAAGDSEAHAPQPSRSSERRDDSP